MSGNETVTRDDDAEALAFEYVLGTLRGEARTRFQQRLEEERTLREAVAFWQEQLMALHGEAQRDVSAALWPSIQHAIQPASARTRSWHWFFPLVSTALLLLVFWGLYPRVPPAPGPNADYVAVLTDAEGAPTLTALSSARDATLWLSWSIAEFAEDSHAQLWAISRRDGQTRPLAVFADTSTTQLALDEALWRLVTDAAYLILTQEEPGGSAIDEPSEVLIAKGVCVRLNRAPKPG